MVRTPCFGRASLALLGLTIWWQLSAKKWFTGPIRQVDEPTKVS